MPATKDHDAPVTMPRETLIVPDPKPTRLYELRVLDGCPKQTINVGRANATFSKFSGNPALGEDGQLVGRLSYPRQLLSDDDIEEIKRYVAARVVLIAPGGTGNVYERNHAALRGQKGIRPLAEFLSLRPVASGEAREPDPVSMAG